MPKSLMKLNREADAVMHTYGASDRYRMHEIASNKVITRWLHETHLASGKVTQWDFEASLDHVDISHSNGCYCM